LYLTTTGGPSIWKALRAQDTWMHDIPVPDRAVHVCDSSCAHEKRLQSVVVMPDNLFADCPSCNGYKKAQLKFYFGLVYMYKKLANEGAANMPKWWIIKDDDTYIDQTNLKMELEKHDPSKPVLLAALSGVCPGICGGGGAALSWKLAEKLGQDGDALLKSMLYYIEKESPYYDEHMPNLVRKYAPGVSIQDSAPFHPYSPIGGMCENKEQNKCRMFGPVNGLVMMKTDQCKCARSRRPATFHLGDGDFERGLTFLYGFNKKGPLGLVADAKKKA